ncbi:hypothetical protein Tco_0741176 [Tanacetum coccineum]
MERVAKQRNTQSSLRETAMSSPSHVKRTGRESPIGSSKSKWAYTLCIGDKGSNGSGHHSPYQIQRRDHLAARSSSQHNAIIGRPGIRKIRAVPSTAHGMLKFPVEGGTVRQKKRGQAPERNKAIQEEVEKLVDAGIMKEVHYHSWLSNPVMVKKHDGTWRMCVDFKDLNNTCPKDCYPLPEIDWKVESLCGILLIKNINMKLNPKKCTYRMQEGMFLKATSRHQRLNSIPDKADAVPQLAISRCIKDVQKSKCDFQWTPEAEEAFKQMKKLIAELPTLTAPREREELIIKYLACTQEANKRGLR